MLLILLLAVNIYAYLLMYSDKQRAIHKEWRISESTLLITAVLGGTLGIWLGMRAPLYHKAAKPKFKISVPLIFALQLIALYFWYNR